MRASRRHGCIPQLLGLILVCVAVVYGVAAIIAPWSFHIGGRSTPFLSWSASGTLHSKSGVYPLYVFFYPSSTFSRLRLDGVRPTGGLQGTAAMCTSRGSIQKLKLSGTIYGGYSSTEGSLIDFRLLEFVILTTTPTKGYFDLYGRWRGPVLEMDERDRVGQAFTSGLRVEHASVTLEPASYAEFARACESASR